MEQNKDLAESTPVGERHAFGEHRAHHDASETIRLEESGASVELREEELTARKQSVVYEEVNVANKECRR